MLFNKESAKLTQQTANVSLVWELLFPKLKKYLYCQKIPGTNRFFLPLDVNITELLTSEEVAVLQNDVLCVPDDNTQLVSAQTHLSLNDRIPKQRWQTLFYCVFGKSHPFGFRGEMSTGGPGCGRSIGNMSTHIWTWPYMYMHTNVGS